MNGTIVVTASGGEVTVTCSASSLPLADTDWFATYRTCPDAWKKAS